MDNLQYLANAELDKAQLKTFSQPAVSFEVASELVTIVGENGTEVKLDSGSQDELAGKRGSLRTREVAHKQDLHRSAGGHHARRKGWGRR
jgi:hypothetical protein